MSINILTFSTLFPNAVQPTHGIFVRTRLLRLLESGEVTVTVVAPVPWYPRFLKGPKQYSRLNQIPEREWQDKLDVWHPRYVIIPKIGMTLAPFFMMLSCLKKIRQLMRQGVKIDLIDAHYFYPDGVAAAAIGRLLKIPVCITARGTDINLIPRYRLPRMQIVRAAMQAKVIFTVCAALKEELQRLGCDASKIIVARNGVDLKLFRPAGDRGALRTELGITGLSVLSVGHLIERKGHDLCIRAIGEIPEGTLYIAGDGPERENLERLASALGVSDRVRFLGALPQAALQKYYAAADLLLLASSREGWANVLLESMACGTPVVATAIWGTPEVVADPAAGELVPERTAAGLVDGMRRLLARDISRTATRAYAEGFSWEHTTALQLQAFRAITRPAPA